MKPETKLMLQALAVSENKAIAQKSWNILRGYTSMEDALKYAGGFLTAVLEGDIEKAMSRADLQNSKALQTVYFKLKQEESK